MVNPIICKEKANTKEGKALSSELEDLNWQLQIAEFDIKKLSATYTVKKMAYKEFIGYSLTDEEKKELKSAKEFLDGSAV